MNLSGLSVQPLCVRNRVRNSQRDLIVLYDEVAFSLGTLRIRERG